MDIAKDLSERGSDGKRAYTVKQIADTFGVDRATIYRHLDTGQAGPEQEVVSKRFR